MMRIQNWKDKLWTLGVATVVLLGYWILKFNCPMLWLLKIPCPCCGMTRAWRCVLELDFAGAFRMHGMFWSVPLLVLYYWFDGKLLGKRWADHTVLILLALGFGVNWIFHLI